jgi:hypothetical protein
VTSPWILQPFTGTDDVSMNFTALHQYCMVMSPWILQPFISTGDVSVSEISLRGTLYNDWLIDYLRLYVPLKNDRDVTITGEGFQKFPGKNYAYTRHSGPLSREGSLSCHTCCDTEPRFSRSHPKDHPI